MRRFYLLRLEDETGVSGTGVVARGVLWADGKVAMRWVVGDYRSTALYDDIFGVEAIHGHDGKTVVMLEVDEDTYVELKDFVKLAPCDTSGV